MTSHHDVAVLVAELRIGFDVSPAIAERAAALLVSQAKALSEAQAKRERMWCTACGTVTRNGVCDCNQYQAGHEMCREPSFVNYADECSKDAREQFSRANAAEARLADLSRALTDVRDWLILAGDMTCREIPLGIIARAQQESKDA